MKLLDLCTYINWYMSLDSVVHFKSTLRALDNYTVSSKYGGNVKRILTTLYYIYKEEDKIKQCKFSMYSNMISDKSNVNSNMKNLDNKNLDNKNLDNKNIDKNIDNKNIDKNIDNANNQYLDNKNIDIDNKNIGYVHDIVNSIDYLLNIPENVGVFIDPSITDKDTVFIPTTYNTFFLSDKDNCKEDILRRYYKYLFMATEPYCFFLLDEKVSAVIKEMFVTNISFFLSFEKTVDFSVFQIVSIFVCITIITVCVLSIFYLVCGIYSTSNPIITEFELERFKLCTYESLLKKPSDSCLICFDAFKDDDEVRVLLCDHYFHKDCVDKWLCEQSSRCPYCRFTNKYYDEVYIRVYHM